MSFVEAYVVATSPVADASVQPPASLNFTLFDNGKVDRTSIVVTVGNEVAYENSALQPGWLGHVVANGNIVFSLRRRRGFAFGARIAVNVAWNETHLVGGD